MSSILRSKKAIVPAALLVVGAAGVGTTLALQEEAVALSTVLDCGPFEFPRCSNPDTQFDKSFVDAAPELTGRLVGGFGGAADCTPQRTPVVFVHGNGDRATSWDSDITGPVGNHPVAPLSVYDQFRDAGYAGCELFGLTYLTEPEQRSPQNNFHEPEHYVEILDFVDAVRDYTGHDRVSIVSHSFGVSMSMAALTWDTETRSGAGWDRVERFVNIAGGLRGLNSCRSVGYANSLFKTCGSQNIFDDYTFGLYPDGPGYANNDWTGFVGPHSLRSMPAAHPGVAFYTISAGAYDQIHCTAHDRAEECAQGPLFEPAENVWAQVDVGTGTPTSTIDNDLSDGSIFPVAGGDADGVGHFKAKNNTGRILVAMLDTDCRQAACLANYESGPAVPVVPR